jgi:molybdate transport system substrate-binding protein
VRRHWLLPLALAATALATGCGAGGGRPTLVVSAAASLQKALTRYGQQFRGATVRFSFAGSDALAAQIEQGIRPDVFASANLVLPAALHAHGLADKPIVFAANRLVVAVPARSTIKDLSGVERRGIAVAVGTPTVPVGSYTETVLSRLAPGQRRALEKNVVDREPDVSGIVGKLTEGAVDAGFLYASDVAATHGALRAISLPAQLQPRVAYAAVIVAGTQERAQAQAFIAGLLHGAGAHDLLAAGFLPPSGG